MKTKLGVALLAASFLAAAQVYAGGITVGPDGNVWLSNGHLWRVNGDGSLTKFAVNGADHIVTGPDRNLWFTDGSNRVRRLNSDGSVTDLTGGVTPGFTANRAPIGITSGPDGNVWFTESADPGAIARVNGDGTVTEFVGGVASGFTANQVPAGITTGPDGNIWFTQAGEVPGKTAVARLNSDGSVTEFVSGVTPGWEDVGTGALEIVTGPDGNVWFTILGGSVGPGALGRVNSDGSVTLFVAGETQGFTPFRWPTGIASGSDGNIWFTEAGGFGGSGAVARLNGNGTVTEFVGGHTAGYRASSRPGAIANGPDGNVWFEENETFSDGLPHGISRVNSDGSVTEFGAP